MIFVVKHTDSLRGTAPVPGSKSHTIRGVVIGALAQGTSVLDRPLDSADTGAAVSACTALGARIERTPESWTIAGTGGALRNPGITLDLHNSGTSLAFLTAIAALADFPVNLDGDASLRTRPVGPLLQALILLGVETASAGDSGRCPLRIRGPIHGGPTRVNGISSQFVSALLVAAPLARGYTEIEVENLHEAPYVEMTLRWLDEQRIRYERNAALTYFSIPGGQHYTGRRRKIPADWSSAAFPLAAAAVTGSNVLVQGVDTADVQGDKAIVDYLARMGAAVTTEKDGVRVRGGQLTGADLDLNSTPDALPILAVLGCFARGETRLHNVAQARIKETDRITVMTRELRKLGADIEELPDGLVIRQSRLCGAAVDGHGDHRVVMALAVAGLFAEGVTTVTTAESVAVTFPSFLEMMHNLGANIVSKE